MKKQILIQYNAETEAPVINLTTHQYGIIPKKIALLGFDYEQKRKEWLDFNDFIHDNVSVESAALHLKLTLDMDEAKAELAPHMNLWCMARKGYSLN